ncbi:MAG: single-stranded DNA-binding protein [Desulfovibrionaceae bacterium]|nr:single-stranded DNA-binding protein [Desulfovibrionaceae bacterium]
MFNKVILVGRLGADPEIRYSASGSPVTRMRVATDESYTDRESGAPVKRTEWHTVVVFQRQAENCKNFLSKGSLVCVEGSLQTRKWQDQQGQERYSTEVKAIRVRFLDRKGDSGEHGHDGLEDEGYGEQRHGGRSGRGHHHGPAEDLGSPFPSGASDSFPSTGSGMDDVPF